MIPRTLNIYWFLLPLTLAISLVYAASRHEPWPRIWRHAARLGLMILVVMALATFALSLAVPQILKHKAIEAYTGGVQGLVLTKPQSPLELNVLGQVLSPDRWLFFFTLAVTALMFWLAWNLLHGRVGRALVAVRDHPTAASAMGNSGGNGKTCGFGSSFFFFCE